MAENKDNTQTSSSTLPPLSAVVKSPIAQVGSAMKGSFQLDEKDKKKLPHSWVRLALILIPIFLLITLAVILFALNKKPSDISTTNEQVQKQPDTPAEFYAKASPFLLIADNADKGTLQAYFAGKSDKWQDKLIDKVPADAAVALAEYQNADEEDKLVLARELYKTVSNPGANDTDPEWVAFHTDFKQKLEAEVGQALF